MSVVLSSLYEVGVQWLKWKLTIFICRSLYDELRTEKVCIPDETNKAPLGLFNESKVHESFTRFNVFIIFMDKTIPRGGDYRVLQRYFPDSFSWIVSMYWKTLVLVWSRRYKTEVRLSMRHPSRDASGYPLRGVHICR